MSDTISERSSSFLKMTRVYLLLYNWSNIYFDFTLSFFLVFFLTLHYFVSYFAKKNLIRLGLPFCIFLRYFVIVDFLSVVSLPFPLVILCSSLLFTQKLNILSIFLITFQQNFQQISILD